MATLLQRERERELKKDLLRIHHDAMTRQFVDPDCATSHRVYVMEMYFSLVDLYCQQYGKAHRGGERWDKRRPA